MYIIFITIKYLVDIDVHLSWWCSLGVSTLSVMSQPRLVASSVVSAVAVVILVPPLSTNQESVLTPAVSQSAVSIHLAPTTSATSPVWRHTSTLGDMELSGRLPGATRLAGDGGTP